MNCADRREPILKDDADRKRFLETLVECGGKTDWQVHAFCLMPKVTPRQEAKGRQETRASRGCTHCLKIFNLAVDSELDSRYFLSRQSRKVKLTEAK